MSKSLALAGEARATRTTGSHQLKKRSNHQEQELCRGATIISQNSQLQRLHTPASKKKKRCVVCTRPVSDGLLGGLYCDIHASLSS
jgi:hypothetical protein